MQTDTETEPEESPTVYQQMPTESLASALHNEGIADDDEGRADMLLAAAERMEKMTPALRAALSALEEEYSRRQDSGLAEDQEYISAIRAPLDAVRDALGVWDE